MLARGYALAVRTCILLALASCTPELTIPPGVVVDCDDGACPNGYFCQQSTGVCVRDSGRRNNRPPVVTAFTLDDDPVLGLVVMRFTVSDSSADVVYVSRLELAFEPSFAAPTELPLDAGAGKSFPSGAVVSLPTSREGVAHSVTWDSAVGAPVANAAAYLRLTVADVYDTESAPAVFGPFAIRNQTPPRAEIVYVKSDGDANAGVVPIVYRLVDDQSDIADVRLEYSSDGVTWTRCSEYPTLLSEGTTNLDSAPASLGGITHAFFWDTIADSYPSASPQLRITAADTAIGEPFVSTAALATGFPNDARYALTAGSISNDRNTCDWVFGQLNGTGLVDGLGSCAYPGVFPVYLRKSGAMIQDDVYRNTIINYIPDRPLIALGDVDDDGDLDVMFGTTGTTTAAGIVLNDGTGSFASPVVTALSGPVSALAAGDFDGDGHDEAALVSQGAVSLLRWTGTAVLDVHAELGSDAVGVASSRLDPEHDVLFVRRSTTAAFETTGALTFGPIPGLGELPCIGPPLALDLDSSGSADLVCAAGESIVAWKDPLASGGRDIVNVANGRYGELYAGDVDNDGAVDLVAMTDTHLAVVPLLSRGGPGLSGFPVATAAPLVVTTAGTHSRLSGVMVSDLDGDGAGDLLVGTADGFAFRFFAAPLPALGDILGRPRLSNRLLGVPNAAVSVDVDRDGANDLVFVHGSSAAPSERGGIELVRASALGGVPILGPGESTLSPADHALVGLAIADLDGDGLLDAATLSYLRNELRIYYGAATPRGAGFAETPVVQALGGSGGGEEQLKYQQPLVACNFDSDERLELAVVDAQTESSYRVVIVDVDEARALTMRPVLSKTAVVPALACEDFNADRRADLLVSGYYSGGGGIYLGDGAGGFTRTDTISSGSAPVLADWNRDGVTDFVLGARGGNAYVLPFRGIPNGNGVGSATFNESTISSLCALGGEASFAAVDLDADGQNELVTVCNNETAFRVSRADVVNVGGGGYVEIGNQSTLSRALAYDADGDDVIDLIGLKSQDQRVVTQPIRRPSTPWSYQATTLDRFSIRLVNAHTPSTDRFGARVDERIALRPYVTSRDGGSRAGLAPHEDLGDLTAAVRMSGSAGVGKALRPLTNAWVALGGLRAKRVRDPLSGAAGATRSKLEARFADSAMLVRIPLRDGEVVNNPRVFIETTDFVRADEAVAGSDGPWENTAGDYLPRDTQSGNAIIVRSRAVHEIPVDPDGDLVTGTGERFVVDSVTRTVRIIMSDAGTVQLFNAPR